MKAKATKEELAQIPAPKFLREIRYPEQCLVCGFVVDGRSRAGGYWMPGRGLVHTHCAPLRWLHPEGTCLECLNGPGAGHSKKCSKRA